MSTATIQTVNDLKKALLQAAGLSISDGHDDTNGSNNGDTEDIVNDSNNNNNNNNHHKIDIAQCLDLLDRLAKVDMTLHLLQETLIGAVVSKLKSNKDMASKSKALIKKWKSIVANETTTAATTVTVTTATATAAVTTPSSSSEMGESQQKKRAKSDVKDTNKKDGAGGGAKKKIRLERRESSASYASEEATKPDLEWQNLPPQRQSICKKIYELLLLAKPHMIKSGINAEAVNHLAAPRAVEVEQAMNAAYNNDRKGYADKARSISFNLKRNHPLCAQVLLGEIEPTELVQMTTSNWRVKKNYKSGLRRLRN